MSDLAELGFRIESQEVETANRRLDDLPGAARRAERASDSLANASRRSEGAMAQMVASIERSVRAMEAMMRAQSGAAAAAGGYATEQGRATAAISQAYSVTAKYSTTLAGLQAGLNGAANDTAKLTAETKKAGAAAQQAANHFDTLYDSAQRDFVGQYVAQTAKAVDSGRKMAEVNEKVAASNRVVTLTTLNLSRQFADIGVTAAMGMSPLMILIQQGPQIADALATAKMQGVNLSAALKGLAASAASLLVTWGPIVAVVGAAVGAFMLFQREQERVQRAMDAAAASLKRMQEEVKETAKMAESLATATDGSATAADAAASAYERQALQAGVLANKLRELNALQLGKEIRESEKRLKDMTAVGNDSGILGTFRTSPNERYSNARERLAKELGFGAMGDRTGQSRSLDDTISAIRRNPGAFTAAQRRALNEFNVAEVERTGFDSAYQAERQYLARLYAEANPATKPQPVLLDEIEVQGKRASRSARTPFNAGESELEKAIKAELEARQALTRNVETLAAYKRREVDAELAIQRESLDRAVHNKSISKAAAETALATYESAASAKRELISRQEEAAIAQRALAHRQEMLSGQERFAQIEASMAGSAVKAAQIMEASLLARQALDRDQLAEQTRQAVLWGEMSETAAAELTIQQLAVQQAERAQAAREAQVKAIEAAGESDRATLELNSTRLRAEAELERSAYGRAVLYRRVLKSDQAIALSKAKEAVDVAQIGSIERQRAEQALARLKIEQGAARELAERETSLGKSIDGAIDAVTDFKNAFNREDWGGTLDGLLQTIGAVAAAIEQHGALGGLTAGGAAIAQLVGGKTGRVASSALGIAGAGLGLGAFAGGAAGAAALGTLGLGAGAIGSIAALAGPIGAAAAALYAAAKIFNIGGKPSNKGAGYDLITGAISGKSRDSETEQAVRAAGDSIEAIQKALDAAGIGLTDAVRGLVLGTRDQTQIYLTSGKTLYAAVGDSGAAVDVAFKALIESANFVSEAQKALVQSAVAAGKGFDEVAEILQKYEQAQALSGGLADEILRLTDPKAFDLQGVTRDIAAQREAYQKLSADGFLTSEQLAKINGQLSTLEGLRLNEVMARYAEAVEEVTETIDLSGQRRSLEAQIMRALGDEQGARALERAAALAALDPSLQGLQQTLWNLTDAAEAAAKAQEIAAKAQSDYDTAIGAARQMADGLGQTLRETIANFDGVADRLGAFGRGLSGSATAGASPFAAYRSAEAEFMRLSALPVGSEERLAGLEDAATRFLEASRAVAPDSAFNNRNIDLVRRAVADSEKAARAEADTGRAQLAELTRITSGLGIVDASIQTVAQRMNDLKMALVAVAVADAKRQGGPANDNIDVERYLANNPDLARNWNAGGSLRGVGSTLEEAALAHYMSTGRYEIAAGLRGFARGTDHARGGLAWVGEQGPEIMHVPQGAQVTPNDVLRRMAEGGPSSDDVAEAIQALAEQLARERGGKAEQYLKEIKEMLQMATRGEPNLYVKTA